MGGGLKSALCCYQWPGSELNAPSGTNGGSHTITVLTSPAVRLKGEANPRSPPNVIDQDTLLLTTAVNGVFPVTSMSGDVSTALLQINVPDWPSGGVKVSRQDRSFI